MLRRNNAPTISPSQQHEQKTSVHKHRTRNAVLRWSLAVFSILAMSGVVLHFLAGNTQKSLASSNVRMPNVGVNFDSPNTGGDKIFADAMKSTRAFWAKVSDLGGNDAPQDANGWPTSDAAMMVWEGPSNNNGTYKLTFNGQADLATSFGYGTFSNKQYDAATNTTTATMIVTDTGPENFSLILTNTKRTASSATNSGVTNVKLMRPTAPGSTTPFDENTIFTPWAKSAFANYSYIRFMPGTNFNTSVNWADRTMVNYSSQHRWLAGEAGEGNNIAYEYMIELCNETGKDMYLNIPAKVNDDYVNKLALLVKYGSDGINPYTSPQSNPVFPPLASNLNVYLEYSNETWNFAFQQAHDIYDMANAEVKAGNSPIASDGNDNTYYLGWRFPAERTVQISKIFRNVFGDQEMITRVRPIIEWQYSNMNNTAGLALEFVNSYYNNGDGIKHVTDPHPPSYYLWGGGGAVYYNSLNDDASTLDGIFAAGFPQKNYQETLNVEGQWAHAYGLHFIAYEGGWSVGGDGAKAMQNQGKLDPRAKQTMLDSFNDFAKAGGDLYTAGTYSQWLDIANASKSPLVEAASDISTGKFTPAAPMIGTAVNGTTTIKASSYDIQNDGYISGAPTNLGRVVGYVLRVDKAGTYQIAINAGNTAPGGKINVFVDSTLLSTISVPATGNADLVAGTVSLPAGLHGILLRGAASTSDKSGTINSLTLQLTSTEITPTATPAGVTPTPIDTTPTPTFAPQPTMPVPTATSVPGNTMPANNNTGISSDGKASSANFDGGDRSYSVQALQNAGMVAGQKTTFNGVTFTWSSSAAGGIADNYLVSGQTIPLATKSGATTLAFLGSATNGPTSGTATITYSDGTKQTFTLGFSDWTLNAHKVRASYGNGIVAEMSYRNSTHRSNGQELTSTYLFYFSVPLQAGKTVKSVTLPTSVNHGSMHIFAIGTK